MLLRIVLAGFLSAAGLLAAENKVASPSPADDGFVSIFDGKTLHGWDGNPTYWRVENGCLVGEITPETIVQRNTFIIWRGGEPRDFELMLEYRVSEHGNSGINYRSVQLTDAKWSLAGYQADIDGENLYTGQNYEERGRTFLARRGEVVTVGKDAAPQRIATLGTPPDAKPGAWNSYRLIVRGRHLIHIVNDQVTSVVIDDDDAHRREAGLIGVQVHVGPPMKIEFRNIRLKQR